MRVTLQQVRCFCETARAGSFTSASEALGVSQQAVALQIRTLEQSLGVELFARGGRGVQLTTAGHAFAEHAPASLQALVDAVASVDELGALQRGTIDIGVNSAPAAYRFDEVVTTMTQRFPEVRLRLIGHNSSVSADLVRSGSLEAAIVLLPVDDDRLRVEPLARDEVLYVSADPERARGPITVDQLATAPLIFYDVESAENDPLRHQLAARAQMRGLSLSPRVEVEPIDLALRLVSDGVGDTYVPQAHTFTPYFPAGLYTASFEPAVYDTFAIVTRRGSRISPAMRVLLDMVREHLYKTVASFQGD